MGIDYLLLRMPVQAATRSTKTGCAISTVPKKIQCQRSGVQRKTDDVVIEGHLVDWLYS